MSNFVYAVCTRKTEDGRMVAQAIRISKNTNLAEVCRLDTSLVSLNVMPSRKVAIEHAIAREEAFIRNGSSLFGTTAYTDSVVQPYV